MRQIVSATRDDKEEVLNLYHMQLGREYCPWTENYPTEREFEFDLARDSIFVMKDENSRIIAAISIDEDEEVNQLSCWTPSLQPGGELARLAVHPDVQNQGTARQMLQYGMDVLKERGKKSIHFLVNRYNVKAIRSYAQFDFNVVGECEMFEQSFLCYEKEL